MSAPARGRGDITIRSARPSDAETIAELTRQLGYSAEPSAVASRLSRLLDRKDQQLLVADDGSRAIGWIHMVITEYIESDTFVVIAGLVVDGKCRKQGSRRNMTRCLPIS
jgi:N-acetylglutamate synthase-like GNAT family acetyltransferase